VTTGVPAGVAMMNWMRPEPVETTIARLASAGYDAIELSGEPYDPDRVRALLDEHGLACWGTATIMKDGRDLVHPDADVRRATLEYVKETTALAARLGGKIVTVTPAVGKLEPAASPADERRWAVHALQDAQAHAGELGIRLGIEALNRYETYFVNRCEQALALAEEVDDAFGVVLDVFHMNIEESDPRAAIRSAGSRLVDFHVADNTRSPPGQGTVQWRPLLEELAAIEYEGCMTVEFARMAPLSEDEIEAGTRHAAAFLRRELAELAHAA
jgi:D-psicose/D-tagatose/L-ribulose 3-epimerase